MSDSDKVGARYHTSYGTVEKREEQMNHVPILAKVGVNSDINIRVGGVMKMTSILEKFKKTNQILLTHIFRGREDLSEDINPNCHNVTPIVAPKKLRQLKRKRRQFSPGHFSTPHTATHID